MSHHTFLMQQVKILWQQQDAVTSVEYALMGSLIAVAIVGAVGVQGTNVAALYGLAANCVTFVVSGLSSCA